MASSQCIATSPAARKRPRRSSLLCIFLFPTATSSLNFCRLPPPSMPSSVSQGLKHTHRHLFCQPETLMIQVIANLPTSPTWAASHFRVRRSLVPCSLSFLDTDVILHASLPHIHDTSTPSMSCSFSTVASMSTC
ncbi:hypothetical protein K438DRAFT_1846092, partial [Mycena galopus ATCC 62051]